jgi:hypothetical protein
VDLEPAAVAVAGAHGAAVERGPLTHVFNPHGLIRA